MAQEITETQSLGVHDIHHGGLGQDYLSRYVPDLAEVDLTDGQKLEFLQTLMDIMQSFVRMGFGLDGCGQFLDTLILDVNADSAAVESSTEEENTGGGDDGLAG